MDRDETGGLHISNWPTEMTDENQKTFEQRHRKGPVRLLIARPGAEPMSPVTLVRGVVTNILIAATADALHSTARRTLQQYWQRVLFVVGLGVVVELMAYTLYPNWMNFPTITRS